jgi:bacteriocin-like protein
MIDSTQLETLNDSELEAVQGGMLVCGWLKVLLKVGGGVALGYAVHEYMT